MDQVPEARSIEQQSVEDGEHPSAKSVKALVRN